MISALIKAARLRTLPLAIAAIGMGSILAAYFKSHSWMITALSLSTALLLQILSNFANDYGDFTKGVDQSRTDRVMSSGELNQKQMKRAMIVLVVLSLIAGISLLAGAFKTINIKTSIYFVLGLISIAAALYYTMGSNPYGYSRMGDIAVFIFFGLVSVTGVYYIQNPMIDRTFWLSLLPASSFGLLSVGVLNVNNIRDIENDLSLGKRTLAGRLGKRRAEFYHLGLIILAFSGLWIFFYHAVGRIHFSFFMLFPLYVFHWWIMRLLAGTPNERPTYNRLLKQSVLLNLLLVLVFGIALLF